MDTTNTNWIDLIDNKQSINSLYKTPPCLEQIVIKTIDLCTWPQYIHLRFAIDQMPDIIPQRGLWRACSQTNDGVYMSLGFSDVENFFVNDFDLSSSYYSLDIHVNPKFVYRCITIDNVLVLDRTDRFHVKLSNSSSQLSFSTFIIKIVSIRPVNHNFNSGFRKLTDINPTNLWKK
jgi:hypothetical protein